MTPDAFRHLFTQHRDKLFEAWNRVPQHEFDASNGELAAFIAIVQRIYQTPRSVILRELDAVARNIADNITDDYAPRLPPEE